VKNVAHSFSAISTYETCPKKYFHLYDAKDVKDADSSWAADGKIIHAAMKARVIDGKPLPLNLRHHEKIAARFAAVPGEKHGEMKLAINRAFEPVDFFAPDVFFRVVVDLAIIQQDTAIVVDWKTGKVRSDNTQMALSAAVLSRWMPEIGLFKTILVWLQSKNLTSKNYTASKFPDIWNGLLARTARIEEARKTTRFPAKENSLCGWCPVKQCPFYKERDHA
jgi:PD-(D/E)XK nuclease superfamily